NVIITAGGTSSAFAAKAATSSIPIVALTGDDLVRLGVVASLNRPGGNVTGVSFLATGLAAKRLRLLPAPGPKTALIGVLVNLNLPDAEAAMQDIPSAARSIGQQIALVTAENEGEIEAAFASLVQRRAGALLVASNRFFSSRRDQFVALAAHHAL